MEGAAFKMCGLNGGGSFSKNKIIKTQLFCNLRTKYSNNTQSKLLESNQYTPIKAALYFDGFVYFT
jgi:hypothetical protein